MAAMKGRFVNLNLMQLFTREHQVLPKRTHPLMTMDGQSGALL